METSAQYRETSAQYREFAEQCDRLAKQAKTDAHRKIIEEMAEVMCRVVPMLDHAPSGSFATLAAILLASSFLIPPRAKFSRGGVSYMRRNN